MNGFHQFITFKLETYAMFSNNNLVLQKLHFPCINTARILFQASSDFIDDLNCTTAPSHRTYRLLSDLIGINSFSIFFPILPVFMNSLAPRWYLNILRNLWMVSESHFLFKFLAKLGDKVLFIIFHKNI